MEHGEQPPSSFSRMLEEAIAIKSEYVAQYSRQYNKSPLWYQHSIFSKDDIYAARTLPFQLRLKYAVDRKEEGNGYYKLHLLAADAATNDGSDDDGVPSDDINTYCINAIDQYERALSVFDWIEPMDKENWKSKAIEDTNISHHHYCSASDDEMQAIATLKVSCLLNLAICYQKQQQWCNSIAACDATLAIDTTNAKALYRRAQARYIPASCDYNDNTLAMTDLKNAYRSNPNDLSIVTALKALKAELAQHNMGNKSMITKALYQSKVRYSNECNQEEDVREKCMTMADAVTAINDIDSCIKRHNNDGNYDEAHKLSLKLDNLKTLLTSHCHSISANESTTDATTSEVTNSCAISSDNESYASIIDEARKLNVDLSREDVQCIIESIKCNGIVSSSSSSSSSNDDALLLQVSNSIEHLASKKVAARIIEGMPLQSLLDMLKHRTNIDAVTTATTASDGIKSHEEVRAEVLELLTSDITHMKRSATNTKTANSAKGATDDAPIKALQQLYGSAVFNSSDVERRFSPQNLVVISAVVCYILWRVYLFNYSMV